MNTVQADRNIPFLETEAGVAFYGEDGRLNVRAGGQYPQRDRSQIADALGIDEDDIHVITPMTGGAFGGKDDISREQILAKVADKLNCKSGDPRLASQSIIVPRDRHRIPPKGIGPLVAEGSFNMPWAEKICPGLPHKLFTYCAQVALVEVDLLTGQVEVLKKHNVIDVGRAINRQGVGAQSEGGIAQGLGFALYEDVMTEDGRILNPSLSTYIIPTICDMPKEVETTIIEDPEPLGPYGAKGIAEAVMSPTAAPILNAVYDATGIRFTQVPITSEQILRRLIGED